jgi:hypothetical protein
MASISSAFVPSASNASPLPTGQTRMRASASTQDPRQIDDLLAVVFGGEHMSAIVDLTVEDGAATPAILIPKGDFTPVAHRLADGANVAKVLNDFLG